MRYITYEGLRLMPLPIALVRLNEIHYLQGLQLNPVTKYKGW